MKKFKVVTITTVRSSLALTIYNNELDITAETQYQAYTEGKEILKRYIESRTLEDKVDFDSGKIDFTISYDSAIVLVEEIKEETPKKCQFCKDLIYSDADSIISNQPSPDYGYCGNSESCFYQTLVKLDHGCEQFKK